MKKIIVTLCAAICVFVSAFAFVGCRDKNTLVIASKDFTEQDILGNMVYVYLEEKTDYKLDYKSEMSSNTVFEAMKSGNADLYIDYTGTVYGNYLQQTEVKSAEEVYEITKAEIKKEFDLEMYETLGFNNTYTLSVKPELAERYKLETFSDLAKVADQLNFGGTFEILNRADGIPGLKKAYGMEFKKETSLDGTLRYMAIDKGEVDVIDAFATDGMLENYNLVSLRDDKSFFPPYYAVPIVRADALERFPEVDTLMKTLKNILDDEAMRAMNYKVDVEKKKARDVATDFLKSIELI